ncbi:MAG: ABC transporter ATP-binding protein [Candidatus Competibacteraceae bacterium]|nr:ABC transporter ATP-binding protein [Candidatus Competibacteraceae bacterium]
MSQIRVNNLGKAYKRYPNRWSRLLEWFAPGDRPRHQAHWVMRGVSFSVTPGEAVGIIGNNGAGKSTLLKIITGTTQASEGSVEVSGRIAALLELGMGFHPDFSGRQNVFMAGQLLGHSVATLHQHFAEIEAFAEIGDYIDQPVRTYSSGMQVRLAFSVATAIRPDILIVDEALSVGDAYFQHKSFARIRQFRDQGTTLLFVSHSPGAVKTLCNRVILLDQGIMARDGAPTRGWTTTMPSSPGWKVNNRFANWKQGPQKAGFARGIRPQSSKRWRCAPAIRVAGQCEWATRCDSRWIVR